MISNPLIVSSNEAKKSTTFSCTFSSSTKPSGNNLDMKKLVMTLPKSANSLFKNQSLTNLHLAIRSFAPSDMIKTCFSNATEMFSLLALGIPERSKVSSLL